MGVIEASGVLAIATRMQRLGEQMRKDGALIYKAHGIDFEPKWFPVIYTLSLKPLLSVVELAAEIGYTHPSTIGLLNDLEKQKIIKSSKDKTDERKRLLQLTDKGKALIEQMKPVWIIMIEASNSLINTQNNLMKAIAEVEKQMEIQSFYLRAKSIMATTQ
ncbi:DNA-binding MarR family transcriptional regulator [Pedobacter sp. UYP30]|uniref:MarR family winged helix-turn-helix transcriptional regulator n=1 Tax=Pedobacter sp. UYP30 TaxID=1756400 RepID=UPI00339AE635